MDHEEYLKDRLQNQINWYSRKSRFNKRLFLYFSIIEMVAASSIPFLVNFIEKDTPSFKIVVGVLGILIAVITGIVALTKCQEFWIEYRTTTELLKHQKFLYETQTKPYDGDDAFNLLVENIESLISKEHSRWSKSAVEKRTEKGS